MLAELIIDFLPWPGGRSKDTDHGTEILGKIMSERLYVPETDSPDAIKRALNESGWVDDEVLAAGDLRQGTEPSLASMLTGTALIEVLRPRRSKSLPRHFVLAVTRDRVVAFKTLSSGDDTANPVYELWIRPDAFRSWPRGLVRLVDLTPAKGIKSTAATLELDGLEKVDVFATGNDPSTRQLFELLLAG
jgi:hypothetical protein